MIKIGTVRFIEMKVTKIEFDENNRMIRIGFGKHNGIWFFRIDLWSTGYRFS